MFLYSHFSYVFVFVSFFNRFYSKHLRVVIVVFPSLSGSSKRVGSSVLGKPCFFKGFFVGFFYYTSTDFFSSLLFFSSINFIPFLFPSVFFIFCFSCVFHHVFHFSAIFALTPKFF